MSKQYRNKERVKTTITITYRKKQMVKLPFNIRTKGLKLPFNSSI